MSNRSRDNRTPGFVRPAAQVGLPRPPLPTIGTIGGGGSGLGTAAPVMGTAMPVPPQSFTVLTTISDPTIDQLGYTCDSFGGLSDAAAIEAVRSYFVNHGANPLTMATLTDAIARLVNRIKYDCTVAGIVNGLRQQAYASQQQISTTQNQLNQKNSQLASVQAQSNQKDSQIASLQSQVSSLSSQIQAALPASVQQQIASLQSQLADAQQKLASVGITPIGLLAGAVAGVAGTLIVEKVRK